ncbi:MAG: GHKL domain-containing protein [Ruminiclostridium sp.]|nr:GHKL domain-containing protein [Ruminiclostridium sp.]
MILIVFLSVTIYKLNFFEATAISLISVFILLVSDSALLWFLVNVMKFDLSKLNNTLYIFIANSLFLFLVLIIIATRQYILKKQSSYKISIKSFFLICVIFIVLVCTLNLSFNSKTIQTNPTSVLVFNLVAFAIYFVICLFLVLIYTSSSKQQMLLNLQTKEYEQLIEYTETIEKLYDDIRNQKHDFLNVLFSIKGYIDKEQYNELKNYYYSSVLKEYNEKQPNVFISSLNLIQNPGLKGILSYKLNQATSDGINIFLNIFSNINIQGIGNLDLCKIVGILIDNAIEASFESTQKEIHLGMDTDETGVSITIGNSYLFEPSIDYVFKRGYSTKGKNRGFGLFNVKETLARYPSAQLKTTINNNTFFQELIIPTPKYLSNSSSE